MLIHQERIINSLNPRVRANAKAFLSKVVAISEPLGINPNWLMITMGIETGYRFTANIENPISGATGLIQFMPATARALGTTTAELAAMTELQQLDYVYRYLLPYRSKMNSYQDVYFAVFFPAAIGKPDNWTLQTSRLSAAIIAAQNKGYDTDKNKAITVAEVKNTIARTVPPSQRYLIDNNKKKSI